MRRRFLGVLSGIVALAAWGNVVHATNVAISNGDFSSPDVIATYGGYENAFGAFFSLPGVPTDWTGTNDGSVGVFVNTHALDSVWGQTFPNPSPPPATITVPPLPSPYTSLFINNLGDGSDGRQAVFMYANPGAEMHQLTGATYEAGTSYDLSFGVLASIEGIPFSDPVPDNSPFEAVLYYLDDSDVMQIVAETPVLNSADVQDQNNLTMFDVVIPAVQAGDPEIGKNIGIQFIIPLDAAPGGEWSLGNVSLDSEVPEPASLALLAGGTLGLIFRRRRSVK